MSIHEKGSVLPIMAAIVTGIGLVVAGISIFSGEDRATRLETAARPKLERVAKSLVSYYKVTGALPCPADGEEGDGGADCGVPFDRGVVPWVTLGLDDGLDPWGNQISYRPHIELASASPDPTAPENTANPLKVCDTYGGSCSSPITDQAAFVIFSHGRPRAASGASGTVYGNGAYDAGGAQDGLPDHPAELANISTEPLPNTEFYALLRTPPSLMGGDPDDDDPESAFEQIVLYRIMDDLTGTGGTEDDYDLDLNDDSQHQDFVTTPDSTGGNDEAQPAALGERQGDGKNWIGIGNNNNEDRVGHMQNSRALCAWYPKALKWERGETMRGALVFQFAPGETKETEDQNRGGGFTLTIVPGPRRVSWDDGTVICGEDNDDPDMGLGYKGGSLAFNNAYYDPDFEWDFMLGGEPPQGADSTDIMSMPKMAIEFDTFNNEYGDEEKLERNHVGLLTTWNIDYVGNGNGNNPSCPNTFGLYANASAEDPAMPRYGPSARACTYDSSLQSWLEYVGQGHYTADWYVNNKGAAPYAVRFEIARLCNDDCSVCGTAPPETFATNTEYKDGRDKMWVRVWVEKVEDLATEKFLTDLSHNLWEVEGYDVGNTPSKFINYCGKDPSMQFQSNDINAPSYRKDKVMFDSIKVGVTAAAQFGKGAKGVAASITDLRIKLAP